MNDYFDMHLPEDQIRAISSIGLAHLGDGVYELLVRTWLCAQGKATGRGLHRAAVALVRAPAQAERAERILPLLTEEELAKAEALRRELIQAGHEYYVLDKPTMSDYDYDHKLRRLEELEAAEQSLDIEAMVQAAVDGVERIQI